MRSSFQRISIIGFCAVAIVTWAELASAQGTPSDVATGFVEALQHRNYEKVVSYVDESWVNRELAILGWPGPDSSAQVREQFVRNYHGARNCGMAGMPVQSVSALWAEEQWPSVFPPEPPVPDRSPGWCGTGVNDTGNNAVRNRTFITVLDERIRGKRAAFVEVEVCCSRELQKALFQISLRKGRWGGWRIHGVEKLLE